jgi:hypothetical protein
MLVNSIFKTDAPFWQISSLRNLHNYLNAIEFELTNAVQYFGKVKLSTNYTEHWIH